ncbi:MAG TPA: DMT family transporter [Gemmatimonadales bacterium]|nr:DMT family transporter [Gemmatimonadales bacterium]
MTTVTTSSRTTRLIGYACALGAGAIWGTTGPLSTLLYSQGSTLTGIGFWRLVIGIAGIVAWGLVVDRSLFRIDRRGWLLVGLGGGALVALFEVAYQFAISGTGVAGAAALLYTAPVLVAVLAKPLLGERLTLLRLVLAVVVMTGAVLAVLGGSRHGVAIATTLRAGVFGGALAAVSYVGTTLLARFAVPRYGPMRVLFLEILGGIIILGVVLPIAGHAPLPPSSTGAWVYTILLATGTVVAANVLFFNAAKRIDAAPTAIAATIEPVVGTVLAFLILAQRSTTLGIMGLLMVVAGVAGGYLEEAQPQARR